MKTALILVILFGIAASIAADYLWKRWMADRQRDRNPHDQHNRAGR